MPARRAAQASAASRSRAAARSSAGVHIALLRAVNLGAHGRVGMAELRELVTGLGFDNVRSLLASGNLVFHSDTLAGAELEQRLESAAKRTLGLETDFLIRSCPEWSAVIAQNPFPREAVNDPGHLIVLFLKRAPEGAVEDLRRAIKGRERVELVGRELYAFYPDGAGRSRLTNALIERKLGARSTGRNWNTVLKLAAESGG